MDILDNFEPKPKRVRLNPPRKEFIGISPQVYYKRFAEQKNLCVEWKQVRSKVRNMRVSYNKVKAWEGSTGAGRMKATLLKMCYYYDELDDIFGSKIIETVKYMWTTPPLHQIAPYQRLSSHAAVKVFIPELQNQGKGNRYQRKRDQDKGKGIGIKDEI
ncbi:hypothetical protein CVS40_10482 [Lucilia cuprina]|nr:hypothetical protein CVS40_10482 [Lucilia cuprina]